MVGGTPPPGPTATVTKAPADAFQPEAGLSSIHPNPRVKLSYRTFSISNVDATNVLLSGYQLDVFPLSRRFFRLGAPGTTASIDFAFGATGIYAVAWTSVPSSTRGAGCSCRDRSAGCVRSGWVLTSQPSTSPRPQGWCVMGEVSGWHTALLHPLADEVLKEADRPGPRNTDRR
ncbi:MAG: hypothetical protein ABIS92_07705 [Polyangia bacterium]